jgi:porin
MNKKFLALLTTPALAIAINSASYAGDESLTQEAPDFSSNLTGDWGGMRSKLHESGIDIEAVYTVDFMSNVAGGTKRRGEVLDNADLIFNIDGEKLYNLKGSTISLYFLNNNGGKPNDSIGNVQGVNNIEVAERTAKLFEAWIEQKFVDDKFSIRAGLYNLNSEFYVTDSSGIFLNPTFGIGTEFAQSGENGPSIFPTSSMAVRGKWEPTEKFYLQMAVLDGVSGDPDNPQGTHVQFNDKDGALYVAETGYKFDFAKLSLGGWHYSSESDDLIDVDGNGDALRHRNKGIYTMVEKEFSEKIIGFGRFGLADKDINQTDYAWAVGVNINKPIPSREDGVLGLAATGVHNSSKYKRSQIAGGSEVDSSETAFELTYSDNLTPWLTIQPDVQYTINPGTDPAVDDSWLLGLRLKIAF